MSDTALTAALDDLLDRYGHQQGRDEAHAQLSASTPYALVERSAHDPGEHCISLHETTSRAVQYHDTQEEPTYWDIVALVDLRDGTRWKTTTRQVTDIVGREHPQG